MGRYKKLAHEGDDKLPTTDQSSTASSERQPSGTNSLGGTRFTLDHSETVPLTGKISSKDHAASLLSRFPGYHRCAQSNTIDESVWETVQRDLHGVWIRMQHVLWPKYLLSGLLARHYRAAGSFTSIGREGTAERGESDNHTSQKNTRHSTSDSVHDLEDEDPNSNPDPEHIKMTNRIRSIFVGLAAHWLDADAVLEGSSSNNRFLDDWDLWGPLLFCLLLAFLLSRGALDSQKSMVFSSIFSTVWIGEAVVTVQIKLLSGHVSFFHALSLLGYTLFPLVLAGFASALGLPIVARIPIYLLLVVWALAAGMSILEGSGIVRNRVGLAIYPLSLFYIGLGALCFLA